MKKQDLKYIIVLLALLMLNGQVWANGNVTIVKQVDGEVSTDGGTAVSSISEGTCTLTVVPAAGYYVQNADITGVVTLNAGNAWAKPRRTPQNPGVGMTVTITGTLLAGAGETGTYTFTMPNSPYDVTVTVNFRTCTSITEEMISGSFEAVTFDGNNHLPAVTVTNGTALIEGTDYTAVWTNSSNETVTTAVNADTYTLTVTGQKTYTGTPTKTFTINKAEFNSVGVSGITNQTYSGEAITQTPVVTLNDYTLTDADYAVSGNSETNAGNYTAIITSRNVNFTAGTKQVNYTITAQSKTLNESDVTFGTTTVEYTTGGTTPSITVTGLTEGTDYDVAWKDANNQDVTPPLTNAGDYTATITLKGNYSGDPFTPTQKFTIAPKAVASPTITLSTPSYEYDGTGQSPTVTVKDGDNTISSENYDVVWKNSANTEVSLPLTDADTYTAYVTLTGNYSGEGSMTFTISTKEVASPTIILDASSFTYGGTAKEPTVTVKDGDNTISSENYNVVWTDAQDNTVNPPFTNVGTYTATVTLKGNYSGEGSTAFTVNPASKNLEENDIHFSSSSTVYSPEGVALPTVTVDDLTINDYDVEWKDKDGNVVTTLTSAGEYTATIKLKGNYTGSYTSTTKFEVNPKSITPSLSLSVEEYIYDGTAKTPMVTVKDGNEVLDASNYEVAYSDNTNAGTASVTVTLKGNYSGSNSATFTIHPHEITKDGSTIQEDGNNVTLTHVTEDAGKIAVPNAVDGKTITAIQDGIFAGTTAPYIDLTAATGLSDLTVDRSNGTFQGVSESTLIILPGNKGHNAASGEKNVIIGGTCNDLQLKDANGYASPISFTATTVTYDRNLTAGIAYTVYLPYSVPQTETMKFYEFVGIEDNVVKFKEKEEEATSPLTPYLVVTSENGNFNLTTATTISATPSEGTTGEMRGTLTKINHEDALNFYILQAENKWKKVGDNENAYIPAFRGYIVVYTNAPLRTILDDAKAVGVGSILTVDADGTETWYDMSGKRLKGKPAQGGLYIKNGKKVLVK